MTERKSARKKHWLIAAAVLVIAAVIGTIVYLSDDMRGRETDPSVTPNVDDEELILLHEGRKYRLNDDLETVLIMGIDKTEAQTEKDAEGGSVNHQQADFLLLLLLDEENKTCTPLHINRDTMCTIWQLDIYGDPMTALNGQITLAHAYGSGGKDSCRNQVRAVSELLYDRKIDHYMSFTMDAVPIVNDSVGGVTVTVLDDMSAIDPELAEGQEVTLEGQQALTYVRARYDVGDATNLGRMARQQQYMTALREKLVKRSESNPNFVIKTLTSVSDMMLTDLSAYELSELSNALTTYEFEDIQTIAGEAVKGETFMEYYADEDALYQQVIELFYVPVEE